MITIRRAVERGHANHGWLDTWHSFSFDSYYDPAHVQFGPLRVLNEDFVAPGAGFPPHPHRDMEIITIVLEGAVAHRDSSGGEGVTRAGDVQVMTAGKGPTRAAARPATTKRPSPPRRAATRCCRSLREATRTAPCGSIRMSRCTHRSSTPERV